VPLFPVDLSPRLRSPGTGRQGKTLMFLHQGRDGSKRVKIPSKGFRARVARLTWLAWGVPDLVIGGTDSLTGVGDGVKRPATKSSTTKGPTTRACQ